MRDNERKTKKIISAAVAAAVMLTAVPFSEVIDSTLRILSPLKAFARDKEIHSYDELVKYANTDYNPNDNIIIAISSGGIDLPMYQYPQDSAEPEYTFSGIGTSEHPFEGKITINAAMYKKFNLKTPLFDYISTKAEINVIADNDADRITLTAFEATDKPLFAEHVVSGGSDAVADWKIILDNYVSLADNTTSLLANDHGGIFGEIGDDCRVNFEITDNMSPQDGENADINAENGKNAGYICGTLGENSVLKVKINSGTHTTYSISSSKNAGGIVGEMKSGSQLILNGNGLNGITQEVNANEYAGGIVGKAVDAYIGTAAPGADGLASMTITNELKASGTTLKGKSGNGYLFGYYENTEGGRTIGLSGFNGLAVSTGYANSGGLIGVLGHEPSSAGSVFGINGGAGIEMRTNGSAITTPNGTNTLEIALTSGNNSGGVVGRYFTNDLKNTLAVNDIYTKVRCETDASNTASTGGIIGLIDDSGSNNAAYVSLSDIYAQKTGSRASGGGLVGTAGSAIGKGSFIDVSDYVRVQGKFTAGIASAMKYGVLKINGVTDLSYFENGNSIVNTRESALIYSGGSGSDSTWKLIRSKNGIARDDTGSWGEVLRLSNDGLTGNTIVDETSTYNSSDANYHKVSIPAAPSGSISTLAELVLLAVNIQHNTTETVNEVSKDNVGAALIMDSSSKANTLTSRAITLAANSRFDLSGTGLTGITRDSNVSWEQVYKNTFNGNGSTIVLTIGEAYGVEYNAIDTEVSYGSTHYGKDGCGKIYTHNMSGLFACVRNSTIKNLNITGSCHKKVSNDSNETGGVVGECRAVGTVSFENVTSDAVLYIYRNEQRVRGFVGGLIGMVKYDSYGNISFSGCTSNAEMHECSNYNNGNNDIYEQYFGGYIGYVDGYDTYPEDYTGQLSVDFGSGTACKVGGSYSDADTLKTFDHTAYGGLIGGIRGPLNHAVKRTINISDVEIGSLNITSKVSEKNVENNATYGDMYYGASGGLLGYVWHDTDVEITKLAVGKVEGGIATGPTISLSGGTKLAGLVYEATGHWTVREVAYNAASFNANESASSLGLLVNSGINKTYLGKANKLGDGKKWSNDKKAALYLDLMDMSKYTIGSNVTVNNNVAVFDELVAFAKRPDRDISENGHAIVSINTDSGAVTMTGNSCNTYQNKSVYGQGKVNENTRYYYNLAAIRAKSNRTDAEKLLLWSVYNYANGETSNDNVIKHYFKDTSYTTISGNLDMSGLSYYPIDYPGGMSFGNITKLKFYNEEIENGENKTVSPYDGVVRSTTNSTAKSQHYMMHCGLFRKSANSITFGGNVVIEGNVGILPSGSGFIICDTIYGGEQRVSFKNGSHSITLNGAYVNGVLASTENAPMLISKVDSSTVLNINGVKSQGYTAKTPALTNSGDWFAATSLIGEVGKNDGSSENMTVVFSKIVLDGRTKDVSDTAENSSMTSAYGSNRTIFSKATLLGHFIYTNANSSGEYNYEYSEDWVTPKHQVTYGKEISASVDYPDKQKKYFNSDKWTSPISGDASDAFDFSDGIRPYVGKFDTMANGSHDEKYRELMVNHSTNNLNEGCGTYNDPYIVNQGNLSDLAMIINGSKTPDGSFELCLPKSLSSYSGSGDVNLKWCSGDHAVFHYDNGNYNATVSGTNYSITSDNVRKYLAGAYYQIGENIILPQDFMGLGGVSEKYAFRGVIVGKKLEDENGEETDSYPTVTLQGLAPFVTVSNGCVLKNFDINVSAGVNITATNSNITDKFLYSGGCMSYGAAVGKIMGGDNVIDRVGISFDGTITAGSNAYIVPVGGYVGVVLNGGLFFRNMSGVSHVGLESADLSGFTAMSGNSGVSAENTRYLYCNPIIGRVINGFAVYEGDAYKYAEGTNTMRNGTKNYSITDIDMKNSVGGTGAANVLNVTATDIKVPDAQAWFIMSCIVNCGAGSGSNTSDKSAMANNNLSYSKDNFKPTHIGKYDDVGCGINSQRAKKLVNGANTDICDTDLMNTDNVEMGTSSKVVPYMVYKYTMTENETAFYKKYAKSLAIGRTITVSHACGENEAPAQWHLPCGYRGIGGLINADGANSINYNISVKGIVGNGTVINLDMKYQSYQWKLSHEDNYPPYDKGFGLFNEFKPSGAVTVSDLTLKGKVFADAYDKSDGIVKYLYNNTASNNAKFITQNAHGRLHTGAFAGIKSDTSNLLTLRNVSIVDVDIHGDRRSGGMIGSAAKVMLENCSGTNLKVFGEHDTGGMIGYASYGSSIIGDETNKTKITIDTITEKGFGFKFEDSTRLAGLGGVIGRAKGRFEVKNIILEPAESKAGIVKLDNDVDNKLNSDTSSFVGGIYGGNNGGTVTIENCIINNINIHGTSGRIGGVAGGTYNSNSNDGEAAGMLTIRNVTLNGTQGVNVISSTLKQPIGGAVGCVKDLDIDGLKIYNYAIEKNNNSKDTETANSMGGVVGIVLKSAKVKNILLSNCTFKGDCNPADKYGSVGGLVGKINNYDSITGYNIAFDTIINDFPNGKKEKYLADILGSGTTSNSVKIVGFSRQGTPTDKIYGSDVKSDSYVIFSDYKGTGFDGSGNTEKPKVGGTEASMVTAAPPYVTVNPSHSIIADNTVLTGDGIARTVAELPIEQIISDTSNKRYSAAAADISTFNSKYKSKLSTFSKEVGSIENDFAVLVLEDTNRKNSTEMINSYIRSLTNFSGFTYEADENGKFNVDICKMQLNGNAFVSGGSANLKRGKASNSNTSYFYMKGDEVDAPNDIAMFSLIDVKYYDPTVSSGQSVVYHLYIPVVVKKMLKYTFRIATGAGSNYESDWYDVNGRWGKIGIENFGSPMTLYFEYEYERNFGEWKSAIAYGDDLLDNYDKKLKIMEAGVSLDNDTILVLVDRNDKNRPYYARAQNVISGSGNTKYLDLSNFRASLDDSSSDAFKEKPLQDMLPYTINAQRDDTNGTFLKLAAGNESEATVRAKLAGADCYFRLITEDDTDAAEKYTISVAGGDTNDSAPVNIKESYYITIFSKERTDGAIYHSDITYEPLGLVPTPSKLDTSQNSGQQDVHVVFGKVVTQIVTIAQPDADDPVVVISTNDTVKARIEATIEIPNDSIRQLMDDSVKIYHSFLTYMTKHDNDGSIKKEIVGKPFTYGSYEIRDGNDALLSVPHDDNGDTLTDSGGNQVTSFRYLSMTDSGNYVEFAEAVDIKDWLKAKGSVVKITADVDLQYNGEAKIEAQFPTRADPDKELNFYTEISGASNIAYALGKTAYSKTSEAAEVKEGAEILHYYTKTTKVAKLEYNAYADENGVYGQLGINARTDEQETKNGISHIKTIAVYDVSDIIQSVPASTYDMVRCTFELQQKENSGAYSAPLPIADYIGSVKLDSELEDDDFTVTEQSSMYTFEIKRNKLVKAEDTYEAVMSIPIAFDVYSGAGVFEDSGRMYSNYKVSITVELFDSTAENAAVQKMRKYIVYTNAKLITDFID